MSLIIRTIATLLLTVPVVLAHMQLTFPPPFNASNNPHRTTNPDPYLQFPYDCCGPNARWPYPCRGYSKLLGSPDGAPTATWQVGSTQTWNMGGIGNHWGGSCQVGFSVDDGETFRVVTSYEGNCPHRNSGNGPDGQNFDFTVPHDLSLGVQIFAWIWYNREQEFNMNCAAVSIVDPSRGLSPMHVETSGHGVAFTNRPLMFVANNGNGCKTPRTTAELRFPEPGPDLVTGDGVYPLSLPVGACSEEEMLTQQAYTQEHWW